MMHQLTDAECGAACLAMILSYHGRHASVAECRDEIGVGRSGVSAESLLRAARRHHLEARAYSIEPEQVSRVALPAIAHWDFNHFVVVEHWSPRHVRVADPAQGRRLLTGVEFAASFTGVVLTFEAGAGFEPRRRTAPPGWYLYVKRLLHTPGITGALVHVMGASLLLQAFGLALPLFTKVLVDHVLPLRLTQVMDILGLGAVALLLAHTATVYLRASVLVYLQTRLDGHTMRGFFEHLLALPFSFFQRRSSGDLLLRLNSTVAIRELLTSQTIAAVLDGGLILVCAVALVLAQPWFGLIVFVIGAFQVALLFLPHRWVRHLSQQELLAQSAAQSYLVEALKGIATVKAAGAERRALDQWGQLFRTYLGVSKRRNQLSAALNTAVGAVRTFSPLLLFWIGSREVVEGQLSLGAMLALNGLALAFLAPLTSLVVTGQQVQLVAAHIDRVMDVLETRPHPGGIAVAGARRLAGRIELRDVSFRYFSNEPWAVRRVSLRIEPGQKIALVGRSGAGKSTLAALLLGLHAPDHGTILVDDIPLAQLQSQGLRRQFGVVLQEPVLFSGSIRSNIAFSDHRLPLDRVVRAAQIAVIHDDIMELPMNYEARIAEGGMSLSGGQRQRLAIARAVACEPAILLLDEATSHLDEATEAIVDRQLNALACTRIVIAHRVSTIQNADLIVVLHEGRLVEQGTHTQLLASGTHYPALVARGRRADQGQKVGAPVNLPQ